MPGSEVSQTDSSSDYPLENMEGVDTDCPTEETQGDIEGAAMSREWHEAAFILQIKEQYVLSQAAVDHIVSSTKILMSEVLLGVLDGVKDSVPDETMCLLEEKITTTQQSLFADLSTSFRQMKYFEQHFKLVVSL